MRGAAALALVARFMDERPQSRAIELRKFCGEAIEHGRLGDESIAPLLERVQAGGVGVASMRQQLESLADRFGIDLAHKLSDVLKLPLARAPRRDCARLADRIDQRFR